MQNYEIVVAQWYNNLWTIFSLFILKKFSFSIEEVEDLYQETFLAVHRNVYLGKVKEDTNWKNYILKIGYNLALKKVRKKINTVSLSQENVTNEDKVSLLFNNSLYYYIENEKFDKSLALEVIDKELEKLPKKKSEIIKLFYLEEKPMKEIANKLDIKNVNTAKAEKYKSINLLKKNVNEVWESLEKIA